MAIIDRILLNNIRIMLKDFVEIGKLGKPFGISGKLKLKLYVFIEVLILRVIFR